MKTIKRILSVFFIVLLLVTSVPAAGFEGLFTVKAEAADMKKTISSMAVGETVTFGSYPQTDVTSKLGAELTKAAPDRS